VTTNEIHNEIADGIQVRGRMQFFSSVLDMLYVVKFQDASLAWDLYVLDGLLGIQAIIFNIRRSRELRSNSFVFCLNLNCR